MAGKKTNRKTTKGGKKIGTLKAAGAAIKGLREMAGRSAKKKVKRAQSRSLTAATKKKRARDAGI